MLWGPSVGQAAWEGLATWVAERDWASRATGAFILAFEVTFPVVLFRRSLQPLYALVAVSLHIMNWVLLGLDYWEWDLPCVILQVDWLEWTAPHRQPNDEHPPAKGEGGPPYF